jgi:hypothetical protein
MSTSPFVLQDSQKVNYALNAVDADGNVAQLPAGDTLVVASSATASATVVPDATPAAGSIASGFILGGATLGAVQITATAQTAAGTPDTTIAPATQSFTIVAGSATTIGFTLGTPVSQ